MIADQGDGFPDEIPGSNVTKLDFLAIFYTVEK
jgi:hypothetical protein